MQKARPKKKKGNDELYKDDLMYQMFGEKYLAIRKRNDDSNKIASIDNREEQRPAESRPVRLRRVADIVPGYPSGQ